MIEMHDVIVRLQGELHKVADRVGVLRDLDRQRILDRAHRGKRMGPGADATDALGEGPRVARIAALENHLDAAPHRAGGDGVADDVVGVDIDLDAQVSLDARDGIDDDPFPELSRLKPFGV